MPRFWPRQSNKKLNNFLCCLFVQALASLYNRDIQIFSERPASAHDLMWAIGKMINHLRTNHCLANSLMCLMHTGRNSRTMCIYTRIRKYCRKSVYTNHRAMMVCNWFLCKCDSFIDCYDLYSNFHFIRLAVNWTASLIDHSAMIVWSEIFENWMISFQF